MSEQERQSPIADDPVSQAAALLLSLGWTVSPPNAWQPIEGWCETCHSPLIAGLCNNRSCSRHGFPNGPRVIDDDECEHISTTMDSEGRYICDRCGQPCDWRLR